MMDIQECVVCDASIWPVAHGYLCYKHRIVHARCLTNPLMIEVLRQVSFGERTDFPQSSRSHVWHQLVSVQQSRSWVIELDDILRMYGVHYERERHENDSEAA